MLHHTYRSGRKNLGEFKKRTILLHSVLSSARKLPVGIERTDNSAFNEYEITIQTEGDSEEGMQITTRNVGHIRHYSAKKIIHKKEFAPLLGLERPFLKAMHFKHLKLKRIIRGTQ